MQDKLISTAFLIIITILSYFLFQIIENHNPQYNEYMGTLLTLPN